MSQIGLQARTVMTPAWVGWATLSIKWQHGAQNHDNDMFNLLVACYAYNPAMRYGMTIVIRRYHGGTAQSVVFLSHTSSGAS